MGNNIELYASVLALAFTSLLGYLQWRSGSRVQEADRAEKIGSAYDKLLDTMQEQIAKLEGRVGYLEEQLKRQTNWNARLVRQLVEAGLKPITPDSDPKIFSPKDG